MMKVTLKINVCLQFLLKVLRKRFEIMVELVSFGRSIRFSLLNMIGYWIEFVDFTYADNQRLIQH